MALPVPGGSNNVVGTEGLGGPDVMFVELLPGLGIAFCAF
jgi:hypothetical protein